MRTLHLFAGAGGGLLADLILGHSPVCAIEWDPYCCQVLCERRDDGWFPGLHVHEGDAWLFDPSDWIGRVDCVAAGFPCQPHSLAGKMLGADDPREGWGAVVRVLRALRPLYVFLENVPGLVSSGYLAVVLGDLAALGYDARWMVRSAAEAGAPHERERWMCLATHTDTLRRRRQGDSQRDSQQEQPRERAPQRDNADRLHPSMADPDPDRERGEIRWLLWQRGADAVQRGEDVAYTHIDDRQERSDGSRDPQGQGSDDRATRCGEIRNADGGLCQDGSLTGVHQGPEADALGGRYRGWWSTEPDVGRMAHGVAARPHRIKALGNGQVPLQIARAWRELGGP